MSVPLLALVLLFIVTLAAPTVNFLLPVRPTWVLFVTPAVVWWPIVVLVGVAGSVIGAVPLFWVTEKASEQSRVRQWLKSRWVTWIIKRFSKRPFLFVLILTLTPIPDQLIGIVGALGNYPLRKYLLANAIGRLIFYTPIALAGYFFRGDISRFGEQAIRWFGL